MKNKPNSKKKIKWRGGARTRRKHIRQCGGALFTVLKNAAKIGYTLRGIREWVQRVSPVVTTDVLHLGKYDSVMKTATFFGGYSPKGQSEQATRDVRTC